MNIVPRTHLLVGTLSVLLVAGCSRDPVARARAFVESGDRYAANNQLREAALEYRNALEQQPSSTEAHYKLGVTYEKLGDVEDAQRAFARVTELDEGYPDADLRVALRLLELPRFDDARRLAQRVLAREPRNVRALVVLARAMEGLGDTALAAKHLNEALKIDPRSSEAHVARGLLEFRNGNQQRARDTLRTAVDYGPKSIEALQALGTVLWKAGEVPAAEEAFQKALAVSGDKASAHRLLASFFIETGRPAMAAVHLRAVADESPADKLALADNALALGKADEAAPILSELLQVKAFAGEARVRRAVIARARGRTADAEKELNVAIGDAKAEPAARLMKSELLLAQGAVDDALQHAQRAASIVPGWAEAHYAVGIIQLARGDVLEAERALKRARYHAQGPTLIDVQLAQVALYKGDVDTAVTIAQQLAGARPLPETHALLSRALRARGDLARARQVVTDAQRKWPGVAALETELGFLNLAAGRSDDARAAFERALRAAPSSNEGRYGLVASRVAGGQFDAARSSLEDWRSAAPGDVQLAVLSARLDLAEGKTQTAEQTLQDAVRRTSGDPDAAEALADLYLATGNRAAALKYYEHVAARRGRPVGTLIAIGILKQEAGDAKGARLSYERALALDSNATVAANNLAWLDAAEGQFARAVEVAERAAAGAPEAAQVLDTLGWMYHLAGKPNQAIRALMIARNKTPDNPLYHHHLGVAYRRAGRLAEARASLERALRLSATFTGADEARELLAALP
jgi:tetratricopeptide (TPR) repeat protein